MVHVDAQEIDEKKQKRFEKIDKDSDGKISKEELTKFLDGKTNKKGEPKDANLEFLGGDHDGDGAITLEEYAKGINWKLAKQRQKAPK